mgnify:CR=1 FL=1
MATMAKMGRFEARLDVQEDKWFHLAGAMGIVFIGILAIPGAMGFLVGLGAAILASVGKEAYDLKYGTGWSWADLAADAIGIVIALAVGAAVI